MLKLKQLLSENVLTKLLKEYTEEELGKALDKAFKGGPVATRKFLNSPMGQDASLNSLLKKPEPETDGDAGDDKITVSGPTPISVAPDSMLPTQNIIDAMSSIAFPMGSAKSLALAITRKKGFGTIVISDNLIIDGHHRWSATIAITPDGKINALDVKWPGTDTNEKLAAAQIAIASTLKPGTKQPSAKAEPGTNILGKAKAVTAKIIMANVGKQPDPDAPGPLLNDKMMEVLTDPSKPEHKTVFGWLGIDTFTEAKPEDADKLRQAIANKVAANLALIKKNPSAPDREDMPQFDPKRGGPELKAGGDLTTALKTGKINVSPPFVKDGYKAKGNALKEHFKKIVNMNKGK